MTVDAERGMTIHCGPVALGMWFDRLYVGSRSVPLTPTFARMMGVLLDRPLGEVATYAELRERAWECAPSDLKLNTHIRLLRERAAKVGVEIGCREGVGLYLFGSAFRER